MTLERDQHLAFRSKLGPRYVDSLGDIVQGFMRSDDMRRMRRFKAIHAALRSVLDDHQMAKVQATEVRSGAVTLEVSDGVLCGELRSLHQARLLTALAGAGVNRIVWKVNATQRAPRTG